MLGCRLAVSDLPGLAGITAANFGRVNLPSRRMLRSCDLWLDYNGKAPRTAEWCAAVACRLRHLALLWYQRSGISTAIEAGLPEAILWMQSGHAHDVAAPRYMSPVQDVGGRPSASEDPPAPPEPHGALLLFCTSSAAVGGCSCLARSESRDRIRSRDRPSSTAGSGPPLTGDVTQPGVLSGDGAWAGSGFYHSVFTL